MILFFDAGARQAKALGNISYLKANFIGIGMGRKLSSSYLSGFYEKSNGEVVSAVSGDYLIRQHQGKLFLMVIRR